MKDAPINMAEEIDVVVRFHDPRRLRELTRAIFSLVGQDYRPLRIVLVLQRFSEQDIALTKAALLPFFQDDPEIDFTVVNWTEPEPRDARSVLLNLGVKAARGRYLAFLDYDDVLYPHAHRLLIERLQKSRAAIAFGSVRIMRLRVYDHVFYTEGALPSFPGSTLFELFRRNFCPLHSYVIDRTQVPSNMLTYEPTLTIEEDYDLLLRICARYKSDFGLMGTTVGEYYYKTDGSNTIPRDGRAVPEEIEVRYKAVHASIAHRRRTTLVAPAIQQELGLKLGPNAPAAMTIQDVIDTHP